MEEIRIGKINHPLAGGVQRRLQFVGVMLLSFALGACSIMPEALTIGDIQSRVSGDLANLQNDQEPVTAPVSMYEAMARALKYNLDYKVQLMQRLLATEQLDLQHYDFLPRLVANADYNARSNVNSASSISILTGRQSLEPSTSTDQDIFSSQLSLTWNVLDFGINYYRTRQAADKVLVAEEQKRKVVNRIVEDVRTTYWRATSYERLQGRMDKLSARIEEAIQQSKDILAQKLDKPMQALTYQRELLSIQRELEDLRRNLAIAKPQLAALMNIKPNEKFSLAIPDQISWMQDVNQRKVAELEQHSLENRAELRELQYQQRINSLETKAALLSLLPGVELGGNFDYNSNSFLTNATWLSFASKISGNLLNLLRVPSTQRAQEAKHKLLDAERLAMSMAVLTQLHVSLAQFGHAKRVYGAATDYQKTQANIMKQVRAGAEVKRLSEQALIREEMNTLLADARYDVAYADLENAYASVNSSIGKDPLAEDYDGTTIGSLAQGLKTSLENPNR